MSISHKQKLTKRQKGHPCEILHRQPNESKWKKRVWSNFFLGQKWEMENNDLFANGCLKPAEIHRIRRFVRFNVDALLPRAINSILINFV